MKQYNLSLFNCEHGRILDGHFSTWQHLLNCRKRLLLLYIVYDIYIYIDLCVCVCVFLHFYVFLLLVELGYPVMVKTPCPVWITTYFLMKGSMIFWCFAIESHLVVCSHFLSYLFISPTFIRILWIIFCLF